jgi:hypothetical protein
MRSRSASIRATRPPEEFASLAGHSIAVNADRFTHAWLDLRDRVRAALSGAR